MLREDLEENEQPIGLDHQELAEGDSEVVESYHDFVSEVEAELLYKFPEIFI